MHRRTLVCALTRVNLIEVTVELGEYLDFNCRSNFRKQKLNLLCIRQSA